MERLQKILTFKHDEDISVFMESHDGFELVDEGLAEIVETPVFSKKNANHIQIDPETTLLVNELIEAGVCENVQDVIANAVHSYVVAVLPHSYKLIREK